MTTPCEDDIFPYITTTFDTNNYHPGRINNSNKISLNDAALMLFTFTNKR